MERKADLAHLMLFLKLIMLNQAIIEFIYGEDSLN